MVSNKLALWLHRRKSGSQVDNYSKEFYSQVFLNAYWFPSHLFTFSLCPHCLGRGRSRALPLEAEDRLFLVWSHEKLSCSVPTLFPPSFTLSPNLPGPDLWSHQPIGRVVEPRNRSLLSYLHIIHCDVLVYSMCNSVIYEASVLFSRRVPILKK